MKNLAFVGVALAALAISGCGGGGSSAPAPAPVPTATVAPTAAPTTGPVSVAYTSTFGASGTAPAPLGFPAPTLTAALTATESNYTGSFAASSSCAQVTVAPATSTTGTFTVTGVSPAASGCTITVTGATGFAAVTLASTVATPGGVVLRWYLPNYLTQSAPVPQSATPINVVLLGASYVLAVSEQNYVAGFKAAALTAGCTPGITAVAAATVPAGLPAAVPLASGVAQSLTYYNVVAGSTVVLPLASACSISISDNYLPNPPASIGVQVTAAAGFGQ